VSALLLVVGRASRHLFARLRRVYILFNAKHGMNETDIAMLKSLNDRCLSSAAGSALTLQAVITKADVILPEQVEQIIPKMRKQIFDAAPTCLPPIITSALMRPQFGIQEMRGSIIEACGLGSMAMDSDL
jgi:GTP-binding protein